MRRLHVGLRDGAVGIARRPHLVGAALAALPAKLGEMIGDGGERIRHRGPDVALAVAVEIDRVFVEARRQKLRMPHRAGPRASHCGQRHMALLQHLQREQEFLAELLLAPPEIRLRRKRAHRAVRHFRRAIAGLARPDRQHDRRPARRSAARSCASVARCCSSCLRPCVASWSNAVSFRYSAGVCTNSACAGCRSGRPGITRSGSVRSGSSPRVAASNVARETPSCCGGGIELIQASA